MVIHLDVEHDGMDGDAESLYCLWVELRLEISSCVDDLFRFSGVFSDFYAWFQVRRFEEYLSIFPYLKVKPLFQSFDFGISRRVRAPLYTQRRLNRFVDSFRDRNRNLSFRDIVFRTILREVLYPKNKSSYSLKQILDFVLRIRYT